MRLDEGNVVRRDDAMGGAMVETIGFRVSAITDENTFKRAWAGLRVVTAGREMGP